MRADATGIDIGATEIFVAAPPRATDNVRSFPTFTEDLYALAEWLGQCGIKTVAMESTGVYWIPLFQILQERGFEVWLVDARHVKNVPGRRTDVSDCPWLQFLHSVGLLRASYRPEQEQMIEACERDSRRPGTVPSRELPTGIGHRVDPSFIAHQARVRETIRRRSLADGIEAGNWHGGGRVRARMRLIGEAAAGLRLLFGAFIKRVGDSRLRAGRSDAFRACVTAPLT
jgi:hypothetical protein